MATWFQIGKQFINLEHICSVDINTDDQHGSATSVTVWFTGASNREFHGAEAQQILDYLRAHRTQI